VGEGGRGGVDPAGHAGHLLEPDDGVRRRRLCQVAEHGPDRLGRQLSQEAGLPVSGHGGALNGVDHDPRHRRHVEGETEIGDGATRDRGAAALGRHRQAVLAGELDAEDDVRHLYAAHDESRVAVDHCVEDAA
jgi:hypothetical protein